jgi:hypothetical protein
LRTGKASSGGVEAVAGKSSVIRAGLEGRATQFRPLARGVVQRTASGWGFQPKLARSLAVHSHLASPGVPEARADKLQLIGLVSARMQVPSSKLHRLPDGALLVGNHLRIARPTVEPHIPVRSRWLPWSHLRTPSRCSQYVLARWRSLCLNTSDRYRRSGQFMFFQRNPVGHS